jgi:hypothetical protein
MTTFFTRPTTRTISLLVVLCLLALHAPALTSNASATEAADDLKQIQYKYYFRGKYSEAIDALRLFLARADLRGADIVTAREFLAASYVLSGAANDGKAQFLKMLNADPQYAGPDPAVFKPEVVNTYVEARDDLAAARLRTPPIVESNSVATDVASAPPSTPIYKKWWFYAGLAAVVVVLGAASAKEEEPEEENSTSSGTVTIGVRVP